MEEYIRGLAGNVAQIVDWNERVDVVIREWRAYFEQFDIPPDQQENEVHAVISARLSAGIVSIVAPTPREFGLRVLA